MLATSLVSDLTPPVGILSRDPSPVGNPLPTVQPQRLSWVSAPGPKCAHLQAKCLATARLQPAPAVLPSWDTLSSTYGQGQEF